MDLNTPVYNRLRTFIKPWKSKKYLEWLKDKYPIRDLHHLVGSVGKLKLSDALMVPLTREQHNTAHDNAALFFEDNLYVAVNLLQEYITHLEDTVESLRTSIEGTTSHDNQKED